MVLVGFPACWQVSLDGAIEGASYSDLFEDSIADVTAEKLTNDHRRTTTSVNIICYTLHRTSVKPVLDLFSALTQVLRRIIIGNFARDSFFNLYSVRPVNDFYVVYKYFTYLLI